MSDISPIGGPHGSKDESLNKLSPEKRKFWEQVGLQHNLKLSEPEIAQMQSNFNKWLPNQTHAVLKQAIDQHKNNSDSSHYKPMYKLSKSAYNFWNKLCGTPSHPITEKEAAQMNDQFIKFVSQQIQQILQEAQKKQRKQDAADGNS